MASAKASRGRDGSGLCGCINGRAKVLIALHILLLVYSASGIFSKTAASQPFFSLPFVGLYGGMLLVLFVYALGWQQIIKRIPLTLAFMNKAVTIVWGILWGFLLFGEQINVGKIIGAVFVIAGVILFANAEGKQELSATKDCDSSCDDGALEAESKGGSSRL